MRDMAMEQFSDQMEDQAGAGILDDDFDPGPGESYFETCYEPTRNSLRTAASDTEEVESSVYQAYCHENLPL